MSEGEGEISSLTTCVGELYETSSKLEFLVQALYIIEDDLHVGLRCMLREMKVAVQRLAISIDYHDMKTEKAA